MTDTAAATSSTPAGGDLYVAERRRNPFLRSSRGGRALSALQLPWFTLLPPAGYGVLTTTGRRTGRRRRRCVRVIREGDAAFLVALRPTAWLRNVQADPRVSLRIRGGTFSGTARELSREEREGVKPLYCETVNLMDYLACHQHRPGRPTRARIIELHRTWFEKGTPVVVKLR